MAHMASAVSVSRLLKRTPHADVPTNTALSPNVNSQKGPTILRHAHVHFYHVGSFPTTSIIDNHDYGGLWTDCRQVIVVGRTEVEPLIAASSHSY